jgi:hypothetical protein
MVRSSADIYAAGDYCRDSDWDDLKAFSDGFTPAGIFKSLAKFVISTDGTDIYASNAFQTIYGGSGDTGGVEGDDADATAIFQQVIDDVNAAGGGLIFVAEGTYSFNITGAGNPLVDQKDTVKMIGAGIDATIFKAIGTMPVGGLSLWKMRANTSLCNLTVDMNQAGLTWLADAAYGAADWFGAVVVGDYLDGVRDQPGTNALVDTVKFANCYQKAGYVRISGLGLNFLHGKGASARNVKFYNCYVGQYITYQPHTPANPIENFAYNYYSIDGIYGEDCYLLVNWEIGGAHINNVIGRNCTTGIRMNATPTWLTLGTISNVQLVDCVQTAIALGSAGPPNHVELSNIYIDTTGATYHGIQIVGKDASTLGEFELSNINIKNVGGSGIYASDGGNITLNGGHISKCGVHGIYLVDVYGSVSGAHVFNNSQAASGTNFGIYISQTGADKSQVVLTGNQAYDDQVAPTQLDGIRLDAVTDTVVSGNRCWGNTVGIREISTSNYNIIMGNNVLTNTEASVDLAYVGANSKVLYNLGRYTPQGSADGSGTGSILNTATSAIIAHGCSFTPAVKDITVTLAEDPSNSPGAIWVDTIGAANFTVHCENDPGASNLDFGWVVRRV